MGLSARTASRFAATLTLPSGPHRFIDLRAAAGDRARRRCRGACGSCSRMRCATSEPEAAEAALDAILPMRGTGAEVEIPFRPRRILMHDTTCGPALVDIAAMRDVIAEHGGDPASLSPICPVATSTDHSVGVDRFGSSDALADNMRDRDRPQRRALPLHEVGGRRRSATSGCSRPAPGIMHTINMEHLTPVVGVRHDRRRALGRCPTRCSAPTATRR